MVRACYSIFTVLLLLFVLLGCSSSPKEPVPIRSSSIDSLGKIIDLSNFMPSKVNWKYVQAGKIYDSFFSVPGPTDWVLEAALVCDPNNLSHLPSLTDSTDRKYTYQAYLFDWLSKEYKQVLSSQPGQDYPLKHFPSKYQGSFRVVADSLVFVNLWTS